MSCQLAVRVNPLVGFCHVASQFLAFGMQIRTGLSSRGGGGTGIHVVRVRHDKAKMHVWGGLGQRRAGVVGEWVVSLRFAITNVCLFGCWG